MKKNIGKTDKVIRIIIGLIAMFLGITESAWFFVLAGMAFITAYTGKCGLYKIFGINTCPIENTASPKENII